MNRRIRTRTYGGVRGREPGGSLLLDAGGSQIQQLSDDVEALLFTRSRYTTMGLKPTMYSEEIIASQATLEDLFRET